MADPPERKTVDLSALPDLVVIYLGMRVEEPRGLETLQILGPQIEAAVGEQPDGLLLHEPLTYSDDPLHRHAPVLARLRLPAGVVADVAAQAVVDRLPA
jgi:hypothetical protein